MNYTRSRSITSKKTSIAPKENHNNKSIINNSILKTEINDDDDNYLLKNKALMYDNIYTYQNIV